MDNKMMKNPLPVVTAAIVLFVGYILLPRLAAASITVIALVCVGVVCMFSASARYALNRYATVAITAVAKLTIIPAAKIAGRIPFIQTFVHFIDSRLSVGWIVALIENYFAKKHFADPALRGDLEALAENYFPKTQYPELWNTSIPADIRRPLVVDGKLPNGALPADFLAPNALSSENVGRTARQALIAGVAWAVVMFFVLDPAIFSSLTAAGMQNGQREENRVFKNQYTGEREPLPASRRARFVEQDNPLLKLGDAVFWDEKSFFAAKNPAPVAVPADRWTPSTDEQIKSSRAVNYPSAIWLAMAFGFCVFVGYWRYRMSMLMQQKIADYAVMTKDAVVRNAYRADEREIALTAYREQIEFTTGFDAGTPLLTLGTATGAAYFRGVLTAPLPNQNMRYSLTDAMQNTLILGGTGEGKTRTIIKPLVSQYLQIRQQMIDAGDSHGLSIYATDGKAVLWRDIQDLANNCGQGDDVRVIGCGAGEFGVDLLDGVEPQLVADIISNVAAQAGAETGAGDDFWPSMAAEVIRNCAILAQAWEKTPDGYAFTNESAERIYSLVVIYQLVIDDKLRQRAIDAIKSTAEGAINGDTAALALLPLLTGELTYACAYMSKTWEEMAPNTKTGIIANVTKTMSPFATNTKLREQFASGKPARLMTIDQVWGHIVLINVSSLEYGLAGRIVNIFLKTLLYTTARKREMSDPKIGFRERLLFVADEFQDLITSSLSGLSDATFWNVSRSTGTLGLIATQGLAALEQAVGEIACRNFALQMRSKIVLRVEDTATIEYCSKLSGETLRGYVPAGAYESFAAIEQLHGVELINAEPEQVSDNAEDYKKAIFGSFFHFAGAGDDLLPRDGFTRSPYAVDTRYSAESVAHKIGVSSAHHDAADATDTANEARALMHRAEDKNEAFFLQGNEHRPSLAVSDVVGMGRSHAWMYIQRGGVTRIDLVKIG